MNLYIYPRESLLTCEQCEMCQAFVVRIKIQSWFSHNKLIINEYLLRAIRHQCFSGNVPGKLSKRWIHELNITMAVMESCQHIW